ncbi:MAG: hypothetical protein NTV88_04275 [Candidatus Micrarchaeota archaeon]|nr:hypothetical protein [Candidatus Micrarchaeota archaeon]
MSAKLTITILFLFAFLAGGIYALGCNPGTSECYSDTAYQTCNSHALWDAPVDCQLGTTCVNGACQEPIGCTPGASKCTGTTTYKTCGDHALWGPEQSCAIGVTCSNGQCVPLPQCSSPGTTRCSPDGSNTVQVCNSQLQWETQRACDYGCSNGYCRACNPGSTRCGDTTHYQTCGSDGNWNSGDYCGNNMICSGGSCITNPSLNCQNIGAARCSPSDSSTLQKCNNNNKWTDYQYCSLGCFNSACRVCSTGQTTCKDSATYYMCNSYGQWGLDTSCPTGYVCFLGSCQVPTGTQCSSLGQKRCSPSDASMTQICGSNYIYMDYVKCGSGCANGECMVCQPGTSYCADPGSYKMCDSNGQFTTAVPCAAGQSCSNGKCAPSAVCSESSRQCVGSTIQVCTGGQWAKYTSCSTDSVCTESQGTAYCKQNAAPAPTPAPTPAPAPEPQKDSGLLGLGIIGSIIVVLAVLVIAGAGYFLLLKKNE